MRGKAIRHAINFPEHRITPAYAGKSPACGLWQPQNWDHPRLCGEKETKAHSGTLFPGSPPPMRGKAYNSTADTYHPQDHPRLCGEKRQPKHTGGHLIGSPPPMRGKAPP